MEVGLRTALHATTSAGPAGSVLRMPKNYMLMVFAMDFAYLGVQFSTKSRRRPKAVQGAPKGSHRYSRTAKGTPKDSQWEPKGTQKGGKGSPKETKGTPKTPKRSQRDNIYLKTPDQPPQRTLCYNLRSCNVMYRIKCIVMQCNLIYLI